MRVAILGGGYAGLLTARKLESRLPTDVELVLVDETGTHLVQHELHRVIRYPAFADSISLPLETLLDRTTVRTDAVETINREDQSVELETGNDLSYDVVAICLGADTAYHGLDGVREHATPLKRLEHAERIRREFLDLLAAGGGTVVVGGAGLSGVQVAGEFAALANEESVFEHVRIVLLEQAERIVPGFPERFQRAVRELLSASGVELRTDSAVAGADSGMITFEDGQELAYDQFVWTGGITGEPSMDGHRPRVRATLALDDRTFVVGDAARVIDADGEAVPASAQAAVRASTVAARNIAETVAARREGYRPRLQQWRFDSPGWLVSVGDSAVAQVGPEVLTGPAANLLKRSVGISYLAEHGSLRNALQALRTELDADAELFDHLPE